MGKKRVLVSYGVDIDAVAGWLGSYGGEDSTSDISRGEKCFPVHGNVMGKTHKRVVLQACLPEHMAHGDY